MRTERAIPRPLQADSYATEPSCAESCLAHTATHRDVARQAAYPEHNPGYQQLFEFLCPPNVNLGVPGSAVRTRRSVDAELRTLTHNGLGQARWATDSGIH